MDNAITIGSFDFLESELLAEIYAVALEDHGFEVRRMAGLGPRELVQPALAAGLLEFVPEYSGTALQFLSIEESKPVPNVDAIHNALMQELAGGPLIALAPSPAQNRNAFAVTRESADRYGLTAITDLKEVAPKLTFGGPPECPTRPFCLLGLEDVWDSDSVASWRSMRPVHSPHHALENGYVDVARIFTTDPRLVGGDLVELTDDRPLQPAETVTPIVRHEVLDHRGPEFRQLVNEVSSQMTTAGLRQLNERVAAGMDVSRVARAWISAHDFRHE